MQNSLLVLKTAPSNSKSKVTPLTNLKLPTANGVSCKRSAKTQLPAVASNSHGGLPQRLSKKCLALIIPRIKQAYATHQLKLLKLENKIKKHQEQLKIKINSGPLKATQEERLLGNTQKKCQLFIPAARQSAARGQETKNPCTELKECIAQSFTD